MNVREIKAGTRIALWGATVAVLAGMAAGAGAASQEPAIGDGAGGVQLTEIGTFEEPVNVTFAPGQADKLYVVERAGIVRVSEGGGAPQVFLDISGLTATNVEGGLLSVEFHPGYPGRPYVYAYYTEADTGDIVVSQFDASNPLDADESSRVRTIRIRHRGPNHKGGQIRFGRGGNLFVATGDGGIGTPSRNAQDVDSLLGKMLRIRPDFDGGHTSPDGNPFKGRVPGKPQIYAVGLRNPYRFSFDSQTGRMLLGDVGQNRWEEINLESLRSLRGANFGWDRFEGRHRYDAATRDTPTRREHDAPVLAYRRGFGRSVVAGHIVRDPRLKTLYGRALYTDFFNGHLWSFTPDLVRADDNRPVFATAGFGATGWGEDPVTKELYLTLLTGPVLRLDPSEAD